jgi:site-specific DNA-methyltransferase (adenine-specific)
MDCLEGMKLIPDGTIDAVICDLPYGTTDCELDSIIPLDQLWEQYNRICKENAAIVLFGSEPFSTMLRMSNLKNYRYDWIWLKSLGANPLLCKKQPMKYHENVSVFYRRLPTYNPIMTKGEMRNKIPQTFGNKKDELYGGNLSSFHGIDNINDDYYPRSYQYFPNADQKVKFHPTQKPVDLLRYLVLTYTNEGDTVLDNCSGSGTTAIACIKEKRHFICFEKDETYWKKSVERVKNEQRQLTLF